MCFCLLLVDFCLFLQLFAIHLLEVVYRCAARSVPFVGGPLNSSAGYSCTAAGVVAAVSAGAAATSTVCHSSVGWMDVRPAGPPEESWHISQNKEK